METGATFAKSSMGPKKRVDEDCRREQVLQAVVFADSFDGSFRPATLETPKVLLPLCGVPMLDYTLEVLAKSGVGEIFVVCVSHAAEIAAYLDEQRGRRGRWVRTTTGAELEVITIVYVKPIKGAVPADEGLRLCRGRAARVGPARGSAV